MNVEIMKTILLLKEDNEELGLKGFRYVLSSIARTPKGEEVYVIGQPVFVNKGWVRIPAMHLVLDGVEVYQSPQLFTLTKEEIQELFNISEQTLEEYAKEVKPKIK